MAHLTLRVLHGADRGRVHEHTPTPVTIGREEGNTVQLNDERVSRFHVKIQEDRDKIVLTDLDSTNGTRVNGEDVSLRILRYGDIITLGRTVMVFGNREQIAGRLAAIRTGSQEDSALTDGMEHPASLDFELDWLNDDDALKTLHALEPPDLPDRLGPAQAAQLSELLEYFHVRIRDLLLSVKVKVDAERVLLDQHQWQTLIDIQSRLSEYLRGISHPPDEG
jgi:hypothetical protein